ncbi:hypothetical protein A2165_02650 [Candidatus Curtissbacteria bacterium RBG_13_40_7]|uniref:Glycosyltransferase RgtA/B/C/D-like domain-containing protein n=1 Tax=Candidatus Curtissbacteria bacterium RBG_13_40_7 TaxID=1797706 RepID=A0A1F5FV69_9BACT|nr:MAG: hypothetical protein A2165_02650 [Candidatus Curtissbacteria bacterium RBG_13_40_7]
MSRLEKTLLGINILLYGFLTIFSFAYVDLNLTLTQNPQILSFVKLMQQLGYYNRPQATLIYLIFIALAFLFFVLHLWLFYKSKIGLKYLKFSTILNVIILVFAYPFLSSDLFNYLFDAKIIWKYHASPYAFKPLDFEQDEWLRFMRWTHRYSPYGPLWLGMSLVPAVLGFGKFILNFLTFKIFIGIFHLINSYLIFKTINKINPRLAIFSTAFYALNPLLLIEGVANSHNDVVLATFILVPFYFLSINRIFLSYLGLIGGTLIKYIPILNLPWLLLWSYYPKFRNSKKMENDKNSITKLVLLNLATMTIFTYLFSSFRITVPFVSSGATQVQFQPWYLFWTIPFVAIAPRLGLVAISIAISAGASLRYLPFLYYGDWSQPYTTTFMQIVLIIPAIFVILGIAFFSIKK